jgi:hypothetical protein
LRPLNLKTTLVSYLILLNYCNVIFLDLLADFEDFQKVSTFIKSQTNEVLASNEAFMKYSKKCNLFNLLLILKAAKMTNSLPSLINENFQHFSKNIKDNYSILNLLFTKDVGNTKFFEVENQVFTQILEQDSGEDLYQKANLNMNVSNISLNVNSNPDESFLSENEKEGDVSHDIIKLRNRINTGAMIDIKKTLNFNENVLESLLNFFKIIMAYSGSLLRLIN